MSARRPIPRHVHVVAAGALALASVVHLWDWFATDRMPPGDFPGYVAQVQYVRDALLRYGRLPLWCSECYGGTTNFTGQLKEYLAFPLAVCAGPLLAAKLLLAILKALAALGLYVAVVRLFGAPLAGVIAGYAYGFGAFANHQRELDVALALALVPPIFLASVELLRRHSPGWALALGVLVACQLGNNWVYAAPAPLVLVLLVLFRPWREPGDEANPLRERGLAVRWARLAVGAFGVFLALAGSQLAWIASDVRNHRLFSAESTARQREIYIERSPFLFVNRDDVLGPWLNDHHPPGLDAVIQDAGRRYLGVVALAVCVAGWLAAGRDERLRRWARVAALMLLFQYWLSLGPRTLLWEVAGSLHWGPDVERALRTGLGLGSAVCLLLAAGLALARWRRGAGAARVRVGRLVGAALLLSFPTYSLWVLAARMLPVLEVQRSPGHYFDTASFWLYLLLAVALVAIQRRISRPRLAQALLAAVALAVVVDFWPSRRGFSIGIPMRPLREAGEMLETLPGADGTLRLALTPFYSPLSSWVAAQAPTGHAWGWLRWQSGRYWGDFMQAAAWASVQVDGQWRLAPNASLLAAGRVRYFLLDALSRGPDRLPPPWRRIRASGRFSVWEQPDVSPRALGYRAYVLMEDDPESDAPAIVTRALRADTLGVWEVGPLADGLDLWESARLPAPPFDVTYRRPQPERIRLEAQAGPAPAMVFVSEGYHPWWRATVDAEPAPVLRAAMAFMAVPVGPGSHVIELRLERPVSVASADRVTGAAWIVLALGVPGVALARQRRKRGS